MIFTKKYKKLLCYQHYSIAIALTLLAFTIKASDNHSDNEWAHADKKSAFVLFSHCKNGETNYFLKKQEPTEADSGTYSPFGGKAEQGETPLETASRELLEEMPLINQIGLNQNDIVSYLKGSIDVKIAIKTSAQDTSKYNLLTVFIANCANNAALYELISGNLLALTNTTICNALKKSFNNRESIVVNTNDHHGPDEKIALRSLFFRLKPWFLGTVHQKIEPKYYIYDFRGAQKRKFDVPLLENHNRSLRRKIDTID